MTDIGVEPSDSGEEQEYGKGMVIVAARLAGVQPQGLSSTLANFSDLEGLTRSASRWGPAPTTRPRLRGY